MRALPLTIATAGIVFIALDFRVVSTDVIPDPIGWALVAVAAGALGLRVASTAAVAAAVTSIAEVVLPYQYVLIDTFTGEAVAPCPALHTCNEQLRIDPVVDGRLWLLTIAAIAGGVALAAFLLGLRSRAQATSNERDAQRLVMLALGVTVGWTVPQVIGLVRALTSETGEFDPIWNGESEYAALVGVLVLGWMAVALALAARRPWAVPDDRQRASGWGRMLGS